MGKNFGSWILILCATSLLAPSVSFGDDSSAPPCGGGGQCPASAPQQPATSYLPTDSYFTQPAGGPPEPSSTGSIDEAVNHEIQAADKSIGDSMRTIGMAAESGNTVWYPSTKTALSTATNSMSGCLSAGDTAMTTCSAGLSPKIQGAAAIVGGLLGTIQTMRSMSDACAKYGNAMQIAEDAITAFNGACVVVMVRCNSSCGDPVKDLTAAEETVKHDVAMALKAAEGTGLATQQGILATQKVNAAAILVPKIEQAKQNVGSMAKACGDYKWNLAAAGAGLLQMITQAMNSSQCKKATTAVDCTLPTNALNPTCTSAVDCSLAKNASNVTCICQKAPGTTGCPTALAPMPSSVAVNPGAPPPPGGPIGNFGIPAADNSIPVGSGSPSAAGGSMGSGGGGGGGSPAGGGTGADKAAGDKKAVGVNPNILSGYEGGGGGGGFRGGSSSALAPYMPGGAKDPKRGLASQSFAGGQVTGAGAKSNWEKVNDRYLENKPTLMNGQ